jgi:hypothetical protein
MRRYMCVLAIPVLSLSLSPKARAQDIVPAGTLLRCTVSEPNFSSKTAQIGDPVLCHLGSVQEFGHNVFPRGAYMSGHLEADKEPGHFFGKGYMKIVFDRIGTPNADINVDTKIVADRSYPVDKEGDIKGKGHPKRDAVEWMIPPLWPWKVLTLPARGPRPVLKGEQALTVRLMEDVVVPRAVAANYNSRDWRPPAAQLRAEPSVYPSRSQTPALTNAGYVSSPDPAMKEAAQSVAAPQVPSAVQLASDPRSSSASLTLIALRNESIWAVTQYWVAGDRLDYVLPSGSHESCALNEVDLMRTTQLNSERGITVSFREAPPHQPVL